jgi:hypothetical protein
VLLLLLLLLLLVVLVCDTFPTNCSKHTTFSISKKKKWGGGVLLNFSQLRKIPKSDE